VTDPALPAPLVPTEVDLRDFQYMELDVRVLRDSRFAAQVSGDAFRAGVLLWCAAWHQVPCGSLPDDDVELANLAGYGRFAKEWRKVRAEALTKFVKCSDGRLYHEEVSEKALAAWNSRLLHHYEKARDRLRKANKARETKGMQPLPDVTFEHWNSTRVALGLPAEKAEAFAELPPEAPPPSHGIPAENALRGNGTERERNGEGTERDISLLAADAPPPPNPPAPAPAAEASAPAAERGTRLPKPWVLPKAWGDWALDAYPQWTERKVRDEAANFADHWHGVSGKTGSKLDWLATWRKWCRNPLAHRDDPKTQPDAAAQREAVTAGARALLFGNPQETFDA
jgi:hypothetical protein